jgi:hypothetical protein
MSTINDSDGYRPGMMGLANGRISREIFVNDAIYQEELELPVQDAGTCA